MTELPDDLPQAVVAPPKQRRGIPLVWIIPAIAALIGIWLAIGAIGDLGRTITIRFDTAEGLEAGKTIIRYKDVNIGEINTVTLSKDRKHVLVTARIDKSAQELIVEDAQFWVVRPRFTGGQLSGVSTLLSGAYISVGAGKSKKHKREFVGPEVAPVLTFDQPGRAYQLHAKDLGSIDVGAPIYFRHIKVGEVTAFTLDKNGAGVSLKIFIQAPYDQFVGTDTRFWNASGIDLAFDANGVRLRTQSIASVLLGGIAFGSPPQSLNDTPAAPNTLFNLYRDRDLAMKPSDGEGQIFVMNFKESLRGLLPGAPLDFRGVQVGEVISVNAEYDPKRDWFYFPVKAVLYPERIRLLVPGAKQSNTAERVKRGLYKAVLERGFRAQLRTGNLLTSQLYVALDFFKEKEAEKVKLDWNTALPELPTVQGNFEELQVTLAHILKSLEKVQFDQIATDLQKTLKTLDNSLKGIDKLVENLDKTTGPELTQALKDLRATLSKADKVLSEDSPMQQDVHDTLREVSRAAQSLRALTDMLDRQPEALLRGKQETKP